MDHRYRNSNRPEDFDDDGQYFAGTDYFRENKKTFIKAGLWGDGRTAVSRFSVHFFLYIIGKSPANCTERKKCRKVLAF